MTSTNTGHKAEQAAKVYLEMRGYEIVEQNYRRSRCEIDIVARRHEVIYFVEVNYRRADEHTSGIEYMTPTKLRQLKLAAETWVDEYKWHGDYKLSTIEIAGSNFIVLSFVEDVL